MSEYFKDGEDYQNYLDFGSAQHNDFEEDDADDDIFEEKEPIGDPPHPIGNDPADADFEDEEERDDDYV